jgi:hypothetical protein
MKLGQMFYSALKSIGWHSTIRILISRQLIKYEILQRKIKVFLFHAHDNSRQLIKYHEVLQ